MAKKNIKFQIQSMTGFASGASDHSNVLIELELKTVNSRFLDISCKLPNTYQAYEAQLRSLISEHVGRGRVELVVKRNAKSKKAYNVVFNRSLFESYFDCLNAEFKQKGLNLDANLIATELIKRKEVIDFVEVGLPGSAEKTTLIKLLKQTLLKLNQSRQSEGQKLVADFELRFNKLKQFRDKIAECAKKSPQSLQQKLKARLALISPDLNLDPERLLQEVAQNLMRLDVSEELTRLSVHFQSFAKFIAKSPNGKQLDFLLQEILREFNTITSKVQDAEIQNIVVEAKTEIDRLKEQVQNIE